MWSGWLVLALWACGGGDEPATDRSIPAVEPAPAAPDAPRTVVLVSLDTFRADAAGPGLRSLYGRSVRFDAAMAPAPTTLATHTSVFTGLYPHRHGVPRNEHQVPEALHTLPERLQAADYATGAFLGAMPLGSHTGLMAGFDHVDERFDRARGGLYEQTERDGRKVTDAALAWLGGQDGPAFAFVHYYDAHAPYTPRLNDVPEGGPAQADMALVYAGRQGKAAVSDAALEALYRADARGPDAEVARLVQGLERVGRSDALIVVFADHGESLAAHPEERFDHGNRVFEATVHVPLLVIDPANERSFVVRTPVSLVDVAPTVLGRLGLPPGEVDGVDLGPWLAGESPQRGPVFSEATKPLDPPDEGWTNQRRWKKVRDGKWALHVDPVTEARKLYDLDADPDELDDVAVANPAEVVRLSALLDAWTAQADPLSTERVSDAESLERLKALGYLE